MGSRALASPNLGSRAFSYIIHPNQSNYAKENRTGAVFMTSRPTLRGQRAQEDFKT